jgi:hypothetical protein
VTVTYGDLVRRAQVTVWFLTARLEFNGDGELHPNNRDPRRPTAASLGTQGYQVLPTRCGFHVGYDRGGLPRTNPGRVVEIIGVVEPADVPSRFYFTRLILRDAGAWLVPANRPAQRRSAGSDDTSAREYQDRELQRGQYPAGASGAEVGLVFDVDAPGPNFDNTHRWGETFAFDATFEEILAIGDPPTDLWNPSLRDPRAPDQPSRVWAYTAENGLGVSSPLRWYCRTTVRVEQDSASNGNRPPWVAEVVDRPNGVGVVSGEASRAPAGPPPAGTAIDGGRGRDLDASAP